MVHQLMLLMLGILNFGYAGCQLETQPQQVHLAYGDDPMQMTVTWVTLSTTPASVVEYGLKYLHLNAKGNQTTFIDGGPKQRKLYIHRVTLTDLIPGQDYIYHCGSPSGWSDLFHLKAMPQGNNWVVRLAVYGDMGNINPQSLGRLQEETQKGMYDAILHVGDFAYNMDTDNAQVGDSFMRQIESIAAYVPYMTCVGNHEQAYNFSNYKARFSMPKAGGDGENLFYSFNMGPAHVIAFSTEVYFWTNYGTDIIANQFKWLQKDLKLANRPENRAQRPWIIVMGHKPMYCSNSEMFCSLNDSQVRDPLEELFYDQGVDLTLWAHEHSYERLFPLYNMTMCNGSDTAPYTNPTGPTHIITGSAGCAPDHHDPFNPVRPPWSAFRSEDYGYTRINILNFTHIQLEQVSDDKNGAIIDGITLIKDVHGAGTYTCHKKSLSQPPPTDVHLSGATLENEDLYIKETDELWEDITEDTGNGHKVEHLHFKSFREWQQRTDEETSNGRLL